MENYVLKTETRHAIIREMFDDTIDRNGKIAIDNRQKATYPRSNFLGPNTTEKLECEHHKHGRWLSRISSVLVASEVISMQEMQ